VQVLRPTILSWGSIASGSTADLDLNWERNVEIVPRSRKDG
jgi:hypothetical protein